MPFTLNFQIELSALSTNIRVSIFPNETKTFSTKKFYVSTFYNPGFFHYLFSQVSLVIVVKRNIFFNLLKKKKQN